MTASEESATVKSKSAQSTKTQAGARTDATTRTLSASTNGGSFYIYSYDGRLLAEYNRLNQCVKDYIYIGNRLLAEYKPQEDKMYFYTPDQINSTRIVTDDTGAVVYSAAHDPYGGMQKIWVNTYDPAPKFSGKERDAESGLDYFGARYYDKSLYRFISVDPIINFENTYSNPEPWNLYAYCLNNPTSFLDPDGYNPFRLIIKRTYSGQRVTIGIWNLNNGISGVTLEPEWKDNAIDLNCVSPGVYTITLHWWTKGRVWTLKLQDKNGRKFVLVHWGMIRKNTKGCILVGYDWDISSEGVKLDRSKEAWEDIMNWYWQLLWEDFCRRLALGQPLPKGIVIIEKVSVRPAY